MRRGCYWFIGEEKCDDIDLEICLVIKSVLAQDFKLQASEIPISSFILRHSYFFIFSISFFI